MPDCVVFHEGDTFSLHGSADCDRGSCPSGSRSHEIAKFFVGMPIKSGRVSTKCREFSVQRFKSQCRFGVAEGLLPVPIDKNL